MSVNFADVKLVPLKKIKSNGWNPNEMGEDDFNMLVKSIEEDGFLQPVLISPLDKPDDEGHEYIQIDGEHRADALRILVGDDGDCPCVVKKMDSDQQKFQTVKMNKLRGKFNDKKFTDLVKDLLTRHSLDKVAEGLAFADPSQLEEMIDTARKSIPEDMIDEFDKARDEIKTVDDLSKVLNRLFTKYGNTLPCNFMILDFGGKEHMWVRMKQGQFKDVSEKARECLAERITFDSVIMKVMEKTDVRDFIEKNRGDLDIAEEVEEIPAEGGTDE